MRLRSTRPWQRARNKWLVLGLSWKMICFVCCFMFCWQIFRSYREIPLTSEGLQKLGLCSALATFEKKRWFFAPHLLWHGALIFEISSHWGLCSKIRLVLSTCKLWEKKGDFSRGTCCDMGPWFLKSHLIEAFPFNPLLQGYWGSIRTIIPTGQKLKKKSRENTWKPLWHENLNLDSVRLFGWVQRFEWYCWQ